MIYNTDIIELIKVTENDTYGNQTTETELINCRIEDTNKSYQGKDGEYVKAKSLILMPDTTEIKKGDRVKINSIMGKAMNDNNEYEIKSVMPCGGFGLTHLEVLI